MALQQIRRRFRSSSAQTSSVDTKLQDHRRTNIARAEPDQFMEANSSGILMPISR